MLYNYAMKNLIIFVCNGNIYRSVIAAKCLENILRKNKTFPDIVVDSYGIQGTDNTPPPKHNKLSEYREEWNASKPILQELGIDIGEHYYQMISKDIIDKCDVVIAMDKNVYLEAKNALLKQFPDQAKKIHVFSELTLDGKDIADPDGISNKEAHRQIIVNIYDVINSKYLDILAWATDKQNQ